MAVRNVFFLLVCKNKFCSDGKMKRKKFSSEIRIRIAYRQDYECKLCQAKLPPTFEIDHVCALSHGGEDCVSNLQALCPNCHREKTAPEIQTLADRRREERTGISKYFNPECYASYR